MTLADRLAALPDTCCICGRPAVTDYDDREDCPSCGRPACEYQMQAGMDYLEECGNR